MALARLELALILLALITVWANDAASLDMTAELDVTAELIGAAHLVDCLLDCMLEGLLDSPVGLPKCRIFALQRSQYVA